MKTLLAAAILVMATCISGPAAAADPTLAWKVTSRARGTSLPPTEDYFLNYYVDRVYARPLADGGAIAASTAYDGIRHLLVVRYASDGAEVWRTRLESMTGGDAIAQDFEVDTAGNSYVVGITHEGEYLLVKVGPEGAESWRSTLPALGPGDLGDSMALVRTDAAGNVYVAGITGGYLLEEAVAKWDPSGRLQWRQSLQATGYPGFQLSDMVVDSSGRAYVTGNAYGKAPTADMVTFRLDPSGTIAWQRVQGAANATSDVPYRMALDAAGAVYITGYMNPGAENALDLFIVKYLANGEQAWLSVPARAAGTTESLVPMGVAVNAATGEAYVTAIRAYKGAPAACTIKFGADGVEKWNAERPRASLYFGANAVTLDAAGDPYVLLGAYDMDGGDFLVIKYHADTGLPAWSARVAGAAGMRDHPGGISVTPDGGVLVAGETYETPEVASMTLVKYSQATVPKARLTLGVSRDTTYVYFDNLFVTAMVRMESPGGSVSFRENGHPIGVCGDRPIVPLAGSADVGLAECALEFPTSFGGYDTSLVRFDASFRYPSGHPAAGSEEVASRSVTIEPDSSEHGGMYWGGEAENGWGLSVTQHADTQFVVIYAYDATGAAEWYVLPGAVRDRSTSSTYSGPLYRPAGSAFDRYDASQFRMGSPVGSATLVYSSPTFATLTVMIDGVPQRKELRRFDFGAEDQQPKLRIGDMWWGGDAQAGWGLSIVQQGLRPFITWFTYRADGTNTFFLVPQGTWNGTRFTGTMFASTSSPWLGRPYDPNMLQMQSVGALSIDFIDQDTADMAYDVQGVKQVKRISRFAF